MQQVIKRISLNAIHIEYIIMRFALASALLLAAKLAPHAAAEDVITLAKRHYYSYGYEGDVTSGAPNG